MLFFLIVKAILLGVLVTAPVGPVGALVIRRTLKSGTALGISTGFGAAIADTSFAYVAALGIASVEQFIRTNERIIAFMGGSVLLVLGVVGYLKHLREKRAIESGSEALKALEDQAELEDKEFSAHKEGSVRHLLRAGLGAFLITVSNPVTVVGFAGAFAAFGFWAEASTSRAETHAWVVGGVFVGAMSWWTSLAAGIRWMRSKLSKSSISMIHLGTNLIILGSGILCLMRGFLKK